jgi:L-ornithine N5-oxygenase
MIHDVIGIGFGPSNIALAIAMEERGYRGSVLFLERNRESRWHEGMLLDGADIQNNPLRDLVTPVNPRSKYTFVNYLHSSGRFFRYLNLGLHYPLRKDFYGYVRWVAAQLPNVRYGVDVVDVAVDHEATPPVWRLRCRDGEVLRARRLVVAVGRAVNTPDIPGLRDTPNVVHLTGYRPAVAGLDRSRTVAVLGASQSAVEIVLDLRREGFGRIYSIHRSFSYRLKDTSPFSDEVYFPEFIDYYHALPPEQRMRLDGQVRPTNYSSADRDVVDALYVGLYEDELDGAPRVRILRNHEIVRVSGDGPLRLTVRDVYTGQPGQLTVDLLVLATGFLDIGRNGQAGVPGLLRNVAHTFGWKGEFLEVERDYRVPGEDRGRSIPDLYLNGLCESSHGLGDAGSFSLVSLRSRDILESIERRSGARGRARSGEPRAAVARLRPDPTDGGDPVDGCGPLLDVEARMTGRG